MPVTGVDGVSRLAVGMAGVDGRAGVDIAMSSPELLFLLGPPLRNLWDEPSVSVLVPRD